MFWMRRHHENYAQQRQNAVKMQQHHENYIQKRQNTYQNATTS